jgi:hypothetical protein
MGYDWALNTMQYGSELLFWLRTANDGAYTDEYQIVG